MNQFSSFFEVFATLNLAYVALESIRRIIINTLTDFYSPDDLERSKERIYSQVKLTADDIKGTGDIFGQTLDLIAARILKKFDDRLKEIKDEENIFLKQAGFNPIFFIGFLFCLSNLILIGYEQLYTESTTFSAFTVEQGFLWYGIYIIILFKEKPEFLFKWLCKHYTILLFFFSILLLSIIVSVIPWKIEFTHFNKIIILISLIIAVSPFVLEYFHVKKYAQKRAEKLEQITNEASLALTTVLDAITEQMPLPKAPIPVNPSNPPKSRRRRPKS